MPSDDQLQSLPTQEEALSRLRSLTSAQLLWVARRWGWRLREVVDYKDGLEEIPLLMRLAMGSPETARRIAEDAQ
jgi:hypothetical protein